MRLLQTLAGASFGFLLALIVEPISTAVAVDRTWESFFHGVGSIWPLHLWLLFIAAVIFIFAKIVELRIRTAADQSLLDDSILQAQFALIASRLADEMSLTPGQRSASEKALVTKILSALETGCKEVPGFRTIFYRLSSDRTRLDVSDWTGTRKPTGPFTSETSRGQAALDFVISSPAGHAELVRDCEKEQREHWRGSGNGYQTYISTVVGTASGPIGMLSMDAPEPGSLSNADKRYATLAAGLLAIAFSPLR
jgi:cbb3-type cytochrome oxidase subunit 3